ncbi:MAG TPA: alanine--tRNA ligase [Candidatus Magasanikbacteria bacterium]|nr:alanine--tRNA ligase [Candidatus Magasanikbacteria bacterium]
MISSIDLRQKYIKFFVSKRHKIIPSASLIPDNDPTVLFTTAGMHPLVPYLLGEAHPEGTRLVNIQKCVRTQDIEEVGDNRHQTFFEMMGNWSLGDYFKEDSIKWSWEFLTGADWLNLDKNKIAVSVFAGDENAPFDEEAFKIWQSVGIPEERIAKLPKKNNWWGPAGITGPCGPDTEIFYWKGETVLPSPGSNPGTDEDNWLEIWNNVFMQYFKTAANTFEPLKQKNVDTGMGMERTLVVLNGLNDVFQADIFWPLILKIEELSGHSYIEGGDITKAMRIMADHLRTATMIMGDNKGIAPSNVDQGYIVRRLIRRAVRYARILEIKDNFCSAVAEETIRIFKDVYFEVEKNKQFILTEITKEEEKFRHTLEKGFKILETKLKNSDLKIFSVAEAFDLYQSYGFPIELTEELLKEKGLEVDVIGFNEEMKKHQELSRAGAEQKFKGGLADTGEMSTKYHTATHLLHAALREVLGDHVAQKGSNITAERLRFDFCHPSKMTDEEKKRVEDLVNMAIVKDYKVTFEEMTVPEAKSSGAIGLFEEKYGNKVKVYSVGDSTLHPHADPNSPTFSKEICGGPHVEHTGLLGKFKIIKEEASSSGVRRIKAILE